MNTRAKPITKPAAHERHRAGRRVIGVLLTGSALTLPHLVLAQSATWNGNTSSDFGTAENWNTGVVPNNANIATLDSAAVPNQPTITTSQSVAQTNVSAGTLTVNSALSSPTTTVSATGTLVVGAEGTLTGNLDTTGAGTASNAGTINGAVTHRGAAFANSGLISGLVENSATFSSTGAINGGLNNLVGSTATVSGTLNGAITSSGALIINGDLMSSSTLSNAGGGTVVINAGADLSSMGTVSNTSSAADGILINGSLTLAPNAAYRVQQAASTRVAVGGTLSLANLAATGNDDRLVLNSNARFLNQGTVNASLTGVVGSSGANTVNDGIWNGGFVVGQNITVTNNGTWNLVDLIGFFDGSIIGNFNNNGAITGGIVSTSGPNARFLNLGTVDTTSIAGESAITTGGTLDNQANWIGSIRLSSRTTPSSATLTNSGTITGAVLNRSGGTLVSTGVITAGLDNEGTATVRGTLNGPISTLAGTLNVNGALSSNGALDNSGTGRIVVESGAVWDGLTSISNAARIDNRGTIVGRIINSDAGDLTSSGTITAGLENAGNAGIGGTISGPIDNTSGTLGINGTAVSDGALTNSGDGVVNVTLGASWTGLIGIENRSTAAAGVVIVGDMTTGGTFRTSSNVAGNPPAVVDVNGGTLTILSGGQLIIGDTISPFGVVTPGSGIVRVSRNAAFESNGTLDVQGTLSIGAAFQATGLLEVTNGSLARAASLCLGCGNANFAGTGELIVDGSNGTASRFEFTSVNGQLAVGNGSQGGGVGNIIVRNGGSWARTVTSTFGMGIASGSSLLVTGFDSRFDLQSPLNLGGSATITNNAIASVASIEQSGGSLTVTDGARLNMTGVQSNAFAEQASVLISGEGTEVNSTGALSINANNPGALDFVVTDNAVFNVTSASSSGLSFGGERRLAVRNGATLNMTGGLLMNRGVLEVTDATVDFGTGQLTMGSLFGGNRLTLINSDFTAGSIGSGLAENEINLGGTVDSEPGAVGAFNVAQLSLFNTQFVINHTATDFVLPSRIDGSTNDASASVIRHLAGTTTMTGVTPGGGAGLYQGRTLVKGGTLRVNGNFGAATHIMTVSNGATLGGTGRIGGTVSIADATLAPGNSPGNLTFGNDLVLGADSILAFELGAPGDVAGVNSDVVTVGGNLTLDGTLNVIDAGGFGEGLYRLFNYGGALTDNVLCWESVAGKCQQVSL
ncbi:MAG TPA: hypothetical protein PK823_09955, partial [Novosphingobium sp.]|nr:hypothetical protein [Novosphingobium sp.]